MIMMKHLAHVRKSLANVNKQHKMQYKTACY